MDVHDIWSVIGGLLTLAIIATVLTKPNTAADINASGTAFTGAVRQAEAG
jgi:hypothetical protein